MTYSNSTNLYCKDKGIRNSDIYHKNKKENKHFINLFSYNKTPSSGFDRNERDEVVVNSVETSRPKN